MLEYVGKSLWNLQATPEFLISSFDTKGKRKFKLKTCNSIRTQPVINLASDQLRIMFGFFFFIRNSKTLLLGRS